MMMTVMMKCLMSFIPLQTLNYRKPGEEENGTHDLIKEIHVSANSQTSASRTHFPKAENV